MASPLTPRDQELLGMPSVISQFPIAFANGDQWEEFDGECLECGHAIPRDSVRGIVSRPIESVAVVEAVGLCRACTLVTRFNYRLHDDMRLTGPRENGWKTWKAKPSLLDRLSAIFR